MMCKICKSDDSNNGSCNRETCSKHLKTVNTRVPHLVVTGWLLIAKRWSLTWTVALGLNSFPQIPKSSFPWMMIDKCIILIHHHHDETCALHCLTISHIAKHVADIRGMCNGVSWDIKQGCLWGFENGTNISTVMPRNVDKIQQQFNHLFFSEFMAPLLNDNFGMSSGITRCLLSIFLDLKKMLHALPHPKPILISTCPTCSHWDAFSFKDWASGRMPSTVATTQGRCQVQIKYYKVLIIHIPCYFLGNPWDQLSNMTNWSNCLFCHALPGPLGIISRTEMNQKYRKNKESYAFFAYKGGQTCSSCSGEESCTNISQVHHVLPMSSICMHVSAGDTMPSIW